MVHRELGCEVRADVTLGEFDDFRWLTVGPPGQDVTIVLMAIPGAPMFEEGISGAIFFETDNCQATYEKLSARGVEFKQEPIETPYGIDSGFRDPSGNSFRITQVLPVTAG